MLRVQFECYIFLVVQYMRDEVRNLKVFLNGIAVLDLWMFLILVKVLVILF